MAQVGLALQNGQHFQIHPSQVKGIDLGGSGFRHQTDTRHQTVDETELCMDHTDLPAAALEGDDNHDDENNDDGQQRDGPGDALCPRRVRLSVVGGRALVSQLQNHQRLQRNES